MLTSLKNYVIAWQARAHQENRVRKELRSRARPAAEQWMEYPEASQQVKVNAVRSLVAVAVALTFIFVVPPIVLRLELFDPNEAGFLRTVLYSGALQILGVLLSVSLLAVLSVARGSNYRIDLEWLGICSRRLLRTRFEQSERKKVYKLWISQGLWAGVGFIIVMAASALAFGWISGNTSTSDVQDNISQIPSSAGIVTYFVTIAFLVPLFEEIINRGLIYGSLRRLSAGVTTRRGVALLFAALPSALVFSIAHGPSFSVATVGTFIGGFGLALLYEFTGSLWPCVVAHVTLNSFHSFRPVAEELLIRLLTMLAS